LNNQDSRSIEISTNDKRIEYFPIKNMIIKGSGSATDIYSDVENPKVKKVANKIIDYTLKNKKLKGEKLKVRRPKIKHRVIMPGESRKNREDLIKSELEYSDVLSQKKKKIQKKKMRIDL
jgi:hypothetical protein